MSKVANIVDTQPPSVANPGAQALDRLTTPYLYAQPDDLRILAANSAAANDLRCSKNELSNRTLEDLQLGIPLQPLIERVYAGEGPLQLDLKDRCCDHWLRAELDTVGKEVTRFLKLSITSRAEGSPIDTAASPHDSIASPLVLQALALLNEQGCQNFSVRKVARRCGLGLGHLQHYYRPKSRLLRAMADAVTFELLHHYERRIAPLANPRERLEAVIALTTDPRRHGNWLKLIRELKTLSQDDPSLGRQLSALYQERHGLFQGLFRAINPALTSAALAAAANDALTLLSDVDDSADSEAHSNRPKDRAHLTARIFGLVNPTMLPNPSNHLVPSDNALDTVQEVFKVATSMATLHTGDAQFAALCKAGVRLLGCWNVSIFLGHSGHFRGRHNSGYTDAEVKRLFQRFQVTSAEPLVAQAIESRQCAIAHNEPDDPVISHAVADQAKLATVVAVALFDPGGNACGLITAGYSERLPEFTHLQRQLLLGLARLCEAITHRNAEVDA